MFRRIILLAASLLSAATFCSAVETINAADMVFKSAGKAENGGWQLPLNGYSGTIIQMAKPEKLKVKITAQGVGVIHVHVAGEKQSLDLTKNEYQEYSLTLKLPAGYHNVRLEFPRAINDYIPGRSVTIKSVEFSGNVAIKNSGSDADCLAAADSYIENYRKGDFTVQLSRVKPGTPVTISMVRNGYIFGAAIKGTNQSNTDYLSPDVPADSDEGKYAAFIKSHFNTIVPENAGKWSFCEPKQGEVNMQTVDAMTDFAKRNGLRARMHTAVWHEQLPEWAKTLMEEAAAGDKKAKAELRKAITKRIAYYVSQRASNWEELDVVNEYEHGDMSKVFSVKELAGIYAEAGRAANGRARMAVNNYGFSSSVRDYANWYKDHIQGLLDNGGRVDAIGLQYHTGNWHSASLLNKLLNSTAVFELPTTITEFSIDNDPKKPEFILDEAMRMTFGSDQTIGFVMWDFYRPWMWKNGSALAEKDWTITESGKVYDSLRSKWSTNVVTTVGKDGYIKFRGFYGDYNIQVGGKTYPVTFPEGVESIVSVIGTTTGVVVH